MGGGGDSVLKLVSDHGIVYMIMWSYKNMLEVKALTKKIVMRYAVAVVRPCEQYVNLQCNPHHQASAHSVVSYVR